MKNFSWRLTILGVVLAAAIVYLIPTFAPHLWPHKQINLGLDLQGGMHLVLEVDTEKAVEGTLERLTHEIRDSLKNDRLRHGKLELIQGRAILLSIPSDQDAGVNSLLDREFPDLRMASRTQEGDVITLKLDLPDKEAEHIKTLAVAQALETIRNRIDQFGVSEPDIRNQGENQILIQLPGIKDTQRAKHLIGRTAQLEFKLVDEVNSPEEYVDKAPPPGTELLWQVKMDPNTRREVKTPFLIKKGALLTGAYLTDAKVQIDSQYNEPYVSINFDRKGARIFEKITGENVKKRLAIVLDQNVHSAPVIQEKISGGEARITGNFTPEEARDLAIVLRAGALPAPVKVMEERTVGPSLGADSIRQGLFSMIVGSILVVVFMVVYYSVSGLIADVALVLNILFIAAGLAAFQATLTMPGIAGIILTIGMAVDANVLVFERIREELRIGKTQHSAVSAGYERATLTIMDANVTTLIAALVLFQFGTGPVKGFAVTLSLGVIASLFTALFVTRIIFDYLLVHRRVKKISI